MECKRFHVNVFCKRFHVNDYIEHMFDFYVNVYKGDNSQLVIRVSVVTYIGILRYIKSQEIFCEQFINIVWTRIVLIFW